MRDGERKRCDFRLSLRTKTDFKSVDNKGNEFYIIGEDMKNVNLANYAYFYFKGFYFKSPVCGMRG